MANALFAPGKEGLLSAEIDLDTAVIKVALVRGYTFTSTHKFVSDVTGASGTLHATSSALGTKTVSGGVFDAADVLFPSVTANANNHSLLVFQSSAVGGGSDVAATAQRLVAWLDTGTGLPVVPDGNNVNIAWSSGSSKIFALV